MARHLASVPLPEDGASAVPQHQEEKRHSSSERSPQADKHGATSPKGTDSPLAFHLPARPFYMLLAFL